MSVINVITPLPSVSEPTYMNLNLLFVVYLLIYAYINMLCMHMSSKIYEIFTVAKYDLTRKIWKILEFSDEYCILYHFLSLK